MKHRIKTIAIAATASALTVAGMAVAHGGGDGKGHWGAWPFASGGKSLTYSETHLQDDGQDVTLRVDQGRVVAASETAISIARNDGETVEVPVDGDTKLWGGWWRKHGATVAHHKGDDEDRGGDDRDDIGGIADLPEGKRVLVLRTDDDPAAEAVKVASHRWGSRGHDHDHGRDRDRDDDHRNDD